MKLELTNDQVEIAGQLRAIMKPPEISEANRGDAATSYERWIDATRTIAVLVDGVNKRERPAVMKGIFDRLWRILQVDHF